MGSVEELFAGFWSSWILLTSPHDFVRSPEVLRRSDVESGPPKVLGEDPLVVPRGIFHDLECNVEDLRHLNRNLFPVPTSLWSMVCEISFFIFVVFCVTVNNQIVVPRKKSKVSQPFWICNGLRCLTEGVR